MAMRADGQCCDYMDFYFNACPVHDRDEYKEALDNRRRLLHPLELVSIDPPEKEE